MVGYTLSGDSSADNATSADRRTCIAQASTNSLCRRVQGHTKSSNLGTCGRMLHQHLAPLTKGGHVCGCAHWETFSPSAVAKGLLAASAGSGPAAVGRPLLAVSSANLSSQDSRLSIGPSSMPGSQTSLNVLQRAAKAEQTNIWQAEEQEEFACNYSAAVCQALNC